MYIIQPHYHGIARTAQDYERMAMSGVVAVAEPSFWAGFDRDYPETFLDYFKQISEFEPTRAAWYGIKHYCWVAVNPKEAENIPLSVEVCKHMPKYFEQPTVLGVGEIGLHKSTKNEIATFEMQLDMAFKHDQLVLIHTPHLDDKLKGTRITLDVLKNLILTLDGGYFKGNKLIGSRTSIGANNASLKIAQLEVGGLALSNVNKCLIGSIKNAVITSELSKIEIGEVQENVSIIDFNSEYFFYNYSPNFRTTSFTGQYSKVHLYESLLGYTLKAFGYNTVFHFGDMESKSGPKKDDTKSLMLEIKRRPEEKSSGNLDFDIIHGIMYINLLTDKE